MHEICRTSPLLLLFEVLSYIISVCEVCVCMYHACSSLQTPVVCEINHLSGLVVVHRMTSNVCLVGVWLIRPSAESSARKKQADIKLNTEMCGVCFQDHGQQLLKSEGCNQADISELGKE